MASESNTTTNHEIIKRWAESRGGKPATVKSTERDGDVGVLRIDFPGYSGGGTLEEISWDEFFQKFDEKNLAFLYQEHTSSGEESRFFKLVSRDNAEYKPASASSSKVEAKAPKTEHKDESKTHKTEQKDDGKAHKGEHKDESKARKIEHKDNSKAHKAKGKSHKTEEKKTTKK